MGCFEKVIGSGIGLFFAIGPFFASDLDGKDKCWCIVMGICFFILNLIIPYEAFETFLESIFQSEFSSIIGKWCVIGLISFAVGWGVSSLLF